jgi:hypothetical protein
MSIVAAIVNSDVAKTNVLMAARYCDGLGNDGRSSVHPGSSSVVAIKYSTGDISDIAAKS